MGRLDVSAYCSRHGLSDDDFRARLAAYPDWFHEYSFTNGVTTNGRDPSERKLRSLLLPERLDGKSVLDIGAYDGFFSLQAAALGAERVLATDWFVWDNNPQLRVRERFEFVRDAAGFEQVETRTLMAQQVGSAGIGTFDYVLFLGVLYHAPNMLKYLHSLRAVTGYMAVVETYVDLLDVPGPAAAFYPPGALNDDNSNFWGPNLECVEAMLKRVGFRHLDFIGLWDKNTGDHLPGGRPSIGLRSGRATWHAYV